MTNSNFFTHVVDPTSQHLFLEPFEVWRFGLAALSKSFDWDFNGIAHTLSKATPRPICKWPRSTPQGVAGKTSQHSPAPRGPDSHKVLFQHFVQMNPLKNTSDSAKISFSHGKSRSSLSSPVHHVWSKNTRPEAWILLLLWNFPSIDQAPGQRTSRFVEGCATTQNGLPACARQFSSWLHGSCQSQLYFSSGFSFAFSQLFTFWSQPDPFPLPFFPFSRPFPLSPFAPPLASDWPFQPPFPRPLP